MISLLEIAQSINEADDDKYVSIGFGRFKLKGKEDDDSADVFVKTDSGKYVKSADQKSDDDGGKKPEEPQGGKLSGSDFDRDGGDEPDMDDDAEFAEKYGYDADASTKSFDDEEIEDIIDKMADDAGVSVDNPIELVKIVRNKDEYGNANLGDIHKHINDMADKPKGGSDDDDREEDPNYLFKQDDDDDEDENKVANANSDVIRSLEDMDLNGLDINSVSSETDEGMYAELMGKDVDEPDNAMTVTAFEEGGKIEYGINVGIGHEVIYFDSKEEALEATQKLAKDDKIRKAMDGEGEETLADLGDHAKSIVKGKDETITINGKQYKPIKESGKTINVNLKEKYDRIFRSLK